MARRGKSQARRSSNGSLPAWVWLIIGAVLALAVVVITPKYFNSGQRADGFFRPRPNPEARPSISALDEADPPRPRPVAPQRPLPAPVTEPDYDFYTLLPDQETALSDSEIAARARAEAETEREAAALARREAAAREQREREQRERARAQSPRQRASTRTQTASRPAATTPSAPAANPQPDAASPAAATPKAAPPPAARYLLHAGTFSNPAEAEALKAQIALLGLQARIEAGTEDGKKVHRVRLGPYTSASQLTEVKQRLDHGGLPALAVRID